MTYDGNKIMRVIPKVRPTHFHRAATFVVLISALIASNVTAVHAGPREQARRIHDRLAGVPPSDGVLNQMEADINSGTPLEAANRAMENSAFYTVTLKNLVTPWTNEEQTQFAPLNDYTATVIGMVRDNMDFRQILFGDILYIGRSGLGLPAYAMNNNNHYQDMEDKGIDLKANLLQTTQSAVTGLPAEATAGVVTTRAAARAFFIDGTNRAVLRFTLMNHLCNDLEQVKDITRAPDRIRQDVSRSPGGDSRIFLNNCIGCHAGMDPLAQAYAYYEYQYDKDADPDGNSGRLIYNSAGTLDAKTGTRVQAKYLINADNFKYGYITSDDRWDNYWRSGANAALGWNGALTGSGTGAKSLGMELAYSEAFAQCQVKKVFKTVCLRAPGSSSDYSQVDQMVSSFKSSNYNLKRVFAETAVYCKGD